MGEFLCMHSTLIMQFKIKVPQSELISGRAEIWTPDTFSDIAHGFGLCSMLISLCIAFPKEIIKHSQEVLKI